MGYAMTRDEPKPVDAVTWFASLARLRSEPGRAAASLEHSLRLSYYLTNLAPPPLSLFVRCELEEAGFETLLREEAFEAAAIALIGSKLSYEVTRDTPGRRTTAKVWLNDVCGRASTRSGNAALALMQAWIDLLLQLRDRSAAGAPSVAPTSRRRSLSAPPRSRTSH